VSIFIHHRGRGEGPEHLFLLSLEAKEAELKWNPLTRVRSSSRHLDSPPVAVEGKYNHASWARTEPPKRATTRLDGAVVAARLEWGWVVTSWEEPKGGSFQGGAQRLGSSSGDDFTPAAYLETVECSCARPRVLGFLPEKS
jgi:hypothetical protein